MNRRYILTSIFAAAAMFSSMRADAQERNSSSASDSVMTQPQQESGRLFNVEKKLSTGAVSSVSGNTLYKTPTPNISNTLVGRLTGLTVLQGGGEPGNDNANASIRGAGTYGAGLYNSYKIFVDGFETNSQYFSYLSPSEIDNISVLKDAASLATFGMRGANGILWVTTKRGSIGRPQIKVNARTGIQSALNLNKPLDSYRYANLYNQAVSNDNGEVWTPAFSAAQLQAFQNGSGTNTDWFDEVLKDNGMYSDMDVNFSGGDPTTRYNVVLGYANQGGLLDVNSSDRTSSKLFERFNLRTNLDFSVTKGIEARIDLNGRLENRKGPNFSTSNLWQNLYRYPSSIYPAKDAAGNWSGTAIYNQNPAASINALGFESLQNRYLQGNFGLKESLDFITPGLYAQQGYSFNTYSVSSYVKSTNYARYFNGVTTTNDQTTPMVASALNAQTQYDWRQGTATIGYEKQFDSHKLQSALNYHESEYRADGAASFAYHYQNLSGRANYSYNDKYIAEFGFSYFGADSYKPGNRWGFYPSISAGWIISNEGFLKGNSAIQFLKLRGSAGKSGWSDTDEIVGLSEIFSNGRFLYEQYYSNVSFGGSFWLNNATPGQQGVINKPFIANADLFAEQSMKYNLGLELNLYSKLDLSLDVFLDKRSDIVTYDQTVPSTYGYNFYFSNLGKVTNRGAEASLVYSDKAGKLNYSLFGSAFYNKNTVDNFAEIPTANSFNAYTGRSIGTRIGLVSDGFYQQTDFNADNSLKSGQAVPAFGAVRPGDLKYKDLDGDGLVNEADVTQIGKSYLPEMTYTFGLSLNYGGLDFSTFLQGTRGSDINLLDASTQTIAFVNNGNAFAMAEGAWAYYPAQGIDTRNTATYPRLSTRESNNNFRASSFWIRSADLLRIRNIELGYTFGSSFSNKIGMSKLRVYLNAVNPVTWSPLLRDNEINPEVLNGYSALKSFNTGISVTF